MLTNNQLPPELLRSILGKNALLFVGPALAQATGVATDKRLRNALEHALRHEVPVAATPELEQFIKRADDMELAQVAKMQLGKDSYNHLLTEILTPATSLPPTALYALRALPLNLWLTTNTDRLAERVLAGPQEEETSSRVVIAGPNSPQPIPELANNSPMTLVKLFGDIVKPESLVLTTGDYESYFHRRPELAARLDELLESHTAIFIGYNVRDKAFRRLYSHIGPRLAQLERRAFAFFADLTRYEALWWNRRSLRVIHLSSSGKIEDSIRELVRQVNVHRGPGIAIEPETSPLVKGSAAASASPALEMMEAQDRWAKESWLTAPTSGPMDLGKHFVPRFLRPLPSNEPSLEEALQRPPEQEAQEESVAIETVVGNGGRAVILGDDGAGKTTLLLHLLHTLTGEAVHGGGRTLAFYLPVKALTATENDANPQLIDRLTTHLHSLLPDVSKERITQTLKHAFSEDRALLLLDGLDELAEEEVNVVLEVLARLRRAYRDTNIILSSKASSLQPQWLEGWPRYEILPLDYTGAEHLLKRRAPYARLNPTLLLNALAVGLVEGNPGLPLDLSMIADLSTWQDKPERRRVGWWNDGVLQQLKRTQIAPYAEAVAWDDLAAGARLATHYLTHEREPLTEAHLREFIQEAHRQELGQADANMVEGTFKRLTGPLGLLVGPDITGSYRFRHRQFLAFLAAKRLAASDEAARAAFVGLQAKDPRCNSVWRMAAALMPDATTLLAGLDNMAQGERAGELVKIVLNAQQVEPAWFKAKILEDSGQAMLGPIFERFGDQINQREKLALYHATLAMDTQRFKESGTRINARLVCATLAALNTLTEQQGPLARQATAIVRAWQRGAEHKEAWPPAVVKVPGGTFLHSPGNHRRNRFTTLPTYYIGQTALTVKQWKTYAPAHVMGGAQEPFTDLDNPAVGMSWYEALACAWWYGGRLATDAEWDKAAAWSAKDETRRQYPWGDTWDPSRCNTAETAPKDQGFTTPVDQFGAAGASAYGCNDMAGNTLEWTNSHVDNSNKRIVRGGSWMASADFARTDSALWLAPETQSLGLGFRLTFDKRPS